MQQGDTVAQHGTEAKRGGGLGGAGATPYGRIPVGGAAATPFSGVSGNGAGATPFGQVQPVGRGTEQGLQEEEDSGQHGGHQGVGGKVGETGGERQGSEEALDDDPAFWFR